MAYLGSYWPSSSRAEVGAAGSMLSFYPIPNPPCEVRTMTNTPLQESHLGKAAPTCQRDLHLDSKMLPRHSLAPLKCRNPGAAVGTGPTLGKWPLSTCPMSPPPFKWVHFVPRCQVPHGLQNLFHRKAVNLSTPGTSTWWQ